MQDGLFSLDIALRGPRGRVAIEVDGPYHFTLNTRQPTGPTLIRSAADGPASALTRVSEALLSGCEER